MKRVTGIGGVFFKSKDPKALGEWYRKHLGLDVEEWGGVAFRWVTARTRRAREPRSGIHSRKTLPILLLARRAS